MQASPLASWTVVVLLLPARGWADARALPTSETPVDVLVESWDCASIEKARQAPPSAWPQLIPNNQTLPLRAQLWIRARSSGWTISMPSNRAFSVTSYEAPGYAAERSDATDPRVWQLSFRHLGREPQATQSAPSYLCFEGRELGTDELEFAPTAVFRAQDLNATQWRAAAFGTMLAMSLFSALFYLALKERVFLKYLAYLLVFVLYLACETRAAHRLPALAALDQRDMFRLAGMTIDLASAFAFLFAVEFMGLHRLAPRAARALNVVAAALMPLSLIHGASFVLRSEWLWQATVQASNVLVGGGALLLLVTAGWRAWKGERYARFFVAGWTPLVMTAFAASAQQFFLSRTPAATLDAMLIAGALESVVLAFGLAHRTLGYRRELDYAKELADHDPLSGLLNRRALLKLTRALDTEGDRRGGPIAVVIFDLDHFKRINDERGHAVGDTCIRAFADHLSAEVRRSDIAARYGGEEFIAVLPGASGEVASALAERVRARVEREGAIADGTRVLMTVSGGVAVGDTREGFEELLTRADRALYSAKNGGRNRIIADPSSVRGSGN